jgi:hypothetical protein
MKFSDIPHQRLLNQHIARQTFRKAEEVVHWLGAVQAQDYAAAKWAVAQRTKGLADGDLDKALADASIIRTHVMRPTWHFVAPEDIRWLLALTAPRVKAALAFMDRQLEMDKATLKQSRTVFIKALQDGRQLTREEFKPVFEKAGIETGDLRMGHLLMHAELDAIICSGPRRGKQFTYALLDERVPATKTLSREQALAELTHRYFTSHGPATEEDFMWWCGLTRADVKNGIEAVKRELEQEVIDGKTYWFAASMPRAKSNSLIAYLLPNYDEYVVGYTDRDAIFDPIHSENLDARQNPLFQHGIVINGQIAGTWKRTLKKDGVEIELNPFAPLTKEEKKAVTAMAEKYGEFLGLKVVMRKT